MLGWKILKEGEYEVGLPRLAREEEQAICALEERFREEARRGAPSSEADISGMLRKILIEYSEAEGILLDGEQLEYLPDMARLHIYGLAFIEPILADNEVEEISVAGIGRPAYAYVRKQGWKRVNAMFSTERALTDVINRMARHMGRRITLQSPKLNAILHDGSRLHASLPPLSEGELTLRKFTQEPFSPSDLSLLGTMPPNALALLSLIMQADFSVIVSGNTASGKTTTLNTLFSFVPKNERIVIAEESPEISIPHPHKVRLTANYELGIFLKDLVYDSLRMRPDRFIAGEARNGEEAEALFDSLLGGQARGCYATFHAQSSRETLRRLSLFGISEPDFNSIDAILVQRRMLRYDPTRRKNTEIRKMTELAFGPKKVPLFRYLPETDSWAMGNMECFSQEASSSLGLSPKELESELEKREKFIRGKRGFSEFFTSFQERFYGL